MLVLGQRRKCENLFKHSGARCTCSNDDRQKRRRCKELHEIERLQHKFLQRGNLRTLGGVQRDPDTRGRPGTVLYITRDSAAGQCSHETDH